MYRVVINICIYTIIVFRTIFVIIIIITSLFFVHPLHPSHHHEIDISPEWRIVIGDVLSRAVIGRLSIIGMHGVYRPHNPAREILTTSTRYVHSDVISSAVIVRFRIVLCYILVVYIYIYICVLVYWYFCYVWCTQKRVHNTLVVLRTHKLYTYKMHLIIFHLLCIIVFLCLVYNNNIIVLVI